MTLDQFKLALHCVEQVKSAMWREYIVNGVDQPAGAYQALVDVQDALWLTIHKLEGKL